MHAFVLQMWQSLCSPLVVVPMLENGSPFICTFSSDLPQNVISPPKNEGNKWNIHESFYKYK